MREVILPLLVIAVLIVLNGVFVAAEFAIVAARGPRLERVGGGSWAVRHLRRILSSTAAQDRYIAIAQLGITLATIGLGMYGEPSIAGWLDGPLERIFGAGAGIAHVVATVLAVLIMTYFHVVIGEMIPKALALQAPERTAIGVARPMQLTGILFRPLVRLLNGTGNLLLRLMGIPVTGEERLYSSAELLQLVEESEEEGVVSHEEERLIRNILDFGEYRVQDVMVPRVRVAGIPVQATAEEVSRLLSESEFSRYPVYRGTLDRVVGILHVKDLIAVEVRGESIDLSTLVRRVPRVPETMPVERLLESFKRNRVHMAIVIDEHGGTSGIVTLDDLLEEVVGELDEPEADELPEAEELGDGRYLLAGGMSIHHFNDLFEREIESEGSTTVAGLVLESLKRVPEEGDEVHIEDFGLKVVEMDGLAIRRLLFEPDQPAEDDPAPEDVDVGESAGSADAGDNGSEGPSESNGIGPKVGGQEPRSGERK